LSDLRSAPCGRTRRDIYEQTHITLSVHHLESVYKTRKLSEMRHTSLMCAGAVFFGSLTKSRGANCTAKFEVLVTCVALNGAPTSTPPSFPRPP
jgi:hypothetical protein